MVVELAPPRSVRVSNPILCIRQGIKCRRCDDDCFWSVAEARLEGLRRFVSVLFTLLGWKFIANGEEGVGVKFLGLIVDSVRRMFVVPSERASAVRDALREFQLTSSSHKAVERKGIVHAMGSIVSMAIAIPGVRVWCRALYTHVYAVGNPSTVLLSVDARKELEVLIFLLTFCNGSPFLDPTHDVSMWVDSGEIGWAACVAGINARGHFSAAVIGSSSTHRELVLSSSPLVTRACVPDCVDILLSSTWIACAPCATWLRVAAP